MNYEYGFPDWLDHSVQILFINFVTFVHTVTQKTRLKIHFNKFYVNSIYYVALSPSTYFRLSHNFNGKYYDPITLLVTEHTLRYLNNIMTFKNHN